MNNDDTLKSMTREQKMELLQTLLLKKKLRGQRDLYFFNRFVVEEKQERRQYLVPHVHGEWSEWYRAGARRIKLILVPRGCFKSTFFTVGRSLQAIANNRDSRILIANATLENSQRFLGEIKNHLMNNQTYLELYGQMYDKNMKWNETEIEVMGRGLGSREATVTAAGVGGNLVSQHYSLIIADDLVNLENSSTRYQANKVIDWWKKAFSLLDYDGEMLVIGTRWSYYELYSYMLDHLSDQTDIYIKSAYNKDGSLYFPEMLDDAKLKELKSLQGSYTFSAFYLNNPVDDESALIKHSQIKYYGEGNEKEDVMLPRNLSIFSVCDPALSQEAHRDSSTIVTVGIDTEDNWFVLEVRRGQWTVAELIEELFSVYARWKPLGMSIEVIGQGQGILDPIQREEDVRKIYLPMTEIKYRVNYKKEIRIRSVLQPRFENGKIFIKRDMYDLEEELLQFPKCDHDDIIDPLTDIAEIGNIPDEEETKKEEKDSYFENKLFVKETDLYDEIMGEYF